MPPASFLFSALAGLALAPAFLFVAGRFHARSRTQRQPVLSWFAAFWAGAGTYLLAESLWAVAVLVGSDALMFGILTLHVKILSSTVAFAGLVVYLCSIRGVGRRTLGIIVGLYLLLVAFIETFYSWRAPIGQEAHAWGMQLIYAVEDVEPWWTILVVLLFVPPMLAAASYASLLRRTSEPALRYRIILTSVSFVLFFAPTLIAWRAGDWPLWGALEKLLTAGMLVGIVLAQWPPTWLRKRLEDAVGRERRKNALSERARALV